MHPYIHTRKTRAKRREENFFDRKQRIYGGIINNVNKNFVLASQIRCHRHQSHCSWRLKIANKEQKKKVYKNIYFLPSRAKTIQEIFAQREIRQQQE